MAIAAFMIIILVLGTGFESSPEEPKETEEIKSISMTAAEKRSSGAKDTESRPTGV